ncbi:MAG: carboxylating nicotinate-nucleotide diphosphorylase [Phycisphaerae bacterium]|nr:carboxylating nicotinate-nucleotide diphosphorylase [Phycisphaerae bacterium]
MVDLNTLRLHDLYQRLAASGQARRLFELARDEDLGKAGDVTSQACVGKVEPGSAKVVARSGGHIAGLAAIPELLAAMAPRSELDVQVRDGEHVPAGTAVAVLNGPVHEILGVERTLLNVLGRLSGVATRTAEFVEAMGRGRARLYDTRKTTPGMRVLEKYAVRCGGGFLHRVGLFDAVLIKDNHVTGVRPERLGDVVSDAALRARMLHGSELKFVEVEVSSIEQLRAVLGVARTRGEERRIDIVLLDNMGVGQIRQAVDLRNRTALGVELEASGGVTVKSIAAIAATGVERISTGAITHGATWLDVALDRIPVAAGVASP